MLGPDWTEGCKGCSYVTDHLDGTLEHLGARDVSLVLVSRARLQNIEAFKKRMGWRLPWVSSAGNDFNHDFGVSFTKDEVASQAKSYNFGTRAPYAEENPGMSFFYKDAEGAIFHTYGTFARGLDALLGTYVILDRAPKGATKSSSRRRWTGCGITTNTNRRRATRWIMLPREVAPNAGCACGCSRVAPSPGRTARRSVSDVAFGLLSLGVWVFMPKCPVCLAAYVALWTGLGLSFATAAYVRWTLLALSGSRHCCISPPALEKRSTRQLTQAARQFR